jgi:flavin-dependent dehydrogenase
MRLKSAICVIGGGPAGAAIARRLAQLSHPILVIEKHRFPRPHIGESVSPGVVALLDVLGIRKQVEDQPFLRPDRVLLHWPPYYSGYKTLGPTPGFQVDRAHFDAVMLDSAREAGAIILEGAHLLKCEHSLRGWDLVISGPEGVVTAEGSFLVDATGRRGLIRGKKRRYGAPTFALYNYWQGDGIVGEETRVEAGSQHWYWGAPLPDGTVNATVFMDGQRLHVDMLRLGSVDAVYREVLSRSTLLSSCLDRLPTGPTIVCDATCYFDENPVGPDLIRVGESLFSVDPLSSQGVQIAIGTAVHAAAVVNTILRRSADLEIAHEFYHARQQEAVAFHAATAANLYGKVAGLEQNDFWETRATPYEGNIEDTASGDPVRGDLPPGEARMQLARSAHLSRTPCLERDFVVKRDAVVYPGLRPTVFVNEVEIAPLLEAFRAPITLKEVRSFWSRTIDDAKIEGLLRWAWTRGLIVEAT